MNQTGIEWCDRTWNPMTGCWGPGGSKEKPKRCIYCYARQVAETRTKAFPKGFEPVFHDKRLDLPGKVKDPQVVFVGSMTDMMGEWWHDNEIEAVIDVCDASPHHTFLWLSKNPGRYASFIWPKNCWLGTTVTDQEDVRARIPALLRTPDVKRFLSIEPMLGPVNLVKGYDEDYCYCSTCGQHGIHDTTHNIECVECEHTEDDPDDGSCEKCGGQMERVCLSCTEDGYSYGPVYSFRNTKLPGIHQVILGGQTGRDAPPLHPDWVRSVRDQCAAAGVPFFFKPWSVVVRSSVLPCMYEALRLTGPSLCSNPAMYVTV
ncbi:MAG TPA: DUF5131 family protein [Nitrospirae bacterium]|nr:DUF5131 family protein [Nitrospirota bacterium]